MTVQFNAQVHDRARMKHFVRDLLADPAKFLHDYALMSTGRRRVRRGTSLERGAANLTATTVVMALLGFVSWALAARYYPATEVGRASAIISTATLLASFGQLNLGMFFVRYLPLAGRAIPSLLGKGYLGVIAVSLAFGYAFSASGIDSKMYSSSLERMLLPWYVVCLALFALQDLFSPDSS